MDKIVLKNINEVIYHELLDNGLNVYVYPNKYAREYEIQMLVKVGSNVNHFELDGKDIKVPNGIEHYLEHLTLNIPDGDVDEFFSKTGSYSNAYTSFDKTCYVCRSNTNFEENLKFLIHYVDTPYYNEELVNKERGIIVEEVKMYDNDPYQKMFFSLLSNVFHNDNNKNKIAGNVEDVNNITVEDIHNTYDAFYKKDNMNLIICGNLNPEEVINFVKNVEKDKVEEKHESKVIKEKEEDSVVKEYEEIFDNVLIDKTSIAYKIPKNRIKVNELVINKYLYVINSLLFGETSELRLKLENDNLISGEIGCDIEKGNDHYLVILEFESNKSDEVIKLLDETFAKKIITEEELSRKKKVLISSLIRRYEKISFVMHNIISNLLSYDKIVDNEYELIESINLNDINDFVELIRTSPRSIIKMLNKDK